jgi:tetratricopeptide (TPR) repeat protein
LSLWAALLSLSIAVGLADQALEVEAPLAPLAPIVVTEASGPELFVQANSAYESGDYREAVRLYQSLVAADLDSGHLHYNLGNAYLRNGELGRAIASYRRSQWRLPRDEDVRANLDFARRTTRDALEPPGPSPVVSTLFFWHFGLSRSELARIALALNLIFWSLLGARLFKPRSEALRWLSYTVLVPLLTVVVSLGIRQASPQRVVVVVPQEIEAQSGPGEDAVVRFKLHAGTEVELRDRRDGWLRIALPDGQQGWIESDWAEVVEG